MNDIIKRKDGEVEAVNNKVMHITPETTDINFEDVLAKLTQYVNVADAISHVEKTVEYVVQIPLKYKDAFQTGEVFINQNQKTGVMWPTLYRTLDSGKRQFVDNMPIKPEQITQGNPFESMAISYHNLYMQQQINNLAEIMNQTYKVVERIEQGQLDDRIGRLIAGRDQILLALSSAPENRILAIEQGRSNMLIAQKQLLQTFKRRVENFELIPESGWSRFWLEFKHSGTFKQRDKEFSDIQEYYVLYLQATQMVAASYAINNQMDAAQKVFEIAEQDMREINFDAIKTIDFIHKNNSDMLYHHADEYVAAEREICMHEAQEYDAINIEISGAKLLEVFENERTKKIQEPEVGQ